MRTADRSMGSGSVGLYDIQDLTEGGSVPVQSHPISCVVKDTLLDV